MGTDRAGFGLSLAAFSLKAGWLDVICSPEPEEYEGLYGERVLHSGDQVAYCACRVAPEGVQCARN